jgi:hypothetical protein
MAKQSPFYKTGISKDIKVTPTDETKISAPHPKTGTISFPTVESRESKVSPKQLASMAVDVASFAIPGGAVLKGARLLGKFFKTGKAVKNISKAIPKKVTKNDGYTSIDKGPSNWILTSMKKKPTKYTSIYKGKTNREGYFGKH